MREQASETVSFELKKLRNKVTNYLDCNEYVYRDTFSSWIKEYNTCVSKYNSLTKTDISEYAMESSDLSSTGKTVRQHVIQNFLFAIDELIKTVEKYSRNKNEDKKETPPHQMRKCFKMGVDGCPLNPERKWNYVFVAMPFANNFVDSYTYGIIPALEALGYTYYRADKEVTNKDLMCKICREIQSASLVIVNISSNNPNVMLEQGIAYGLGKPVIIIKDKETKAISDLGCIEYIEYEHAYDLQQKLIAALSKR